MRSRLLERLRPYICKECRLKRSTGAAQLQTHRRFSSLTGLREQDNVQNAKLVRARIEALTERESPQHIYPRWNLSETRTLNALKFKNAFKVLVGWELKKGQAKEDALVTVYGRVTSRRKAGAGLCFVDVESGGITLQTVWKRGAIQKDDDGRPLWNVQEERRDVNRGNWMAMTGYPYLTETGELSLLVVEKPQMLAPSLNTVNPRTSKEEFLIHNRHVDRIIHKGANEVLVVRHRIIQAIRGFFRARNFVEVNTPLLLAQAGGANARPFKTVASEFSDKDLQLRIAPELFLKRLIVGNMEKIYEIGPAFRNEGIDATHNPEFYICEFYQAMADLETLIRMTEIMFEEVFKAVASSVHRSHFETIPAPKELGLEAPYRQLPFIPSLELEIRKRLPGWTFPDLTIPDSALAILEAALVMFDRSFDPSNSTMSLPSLLDALSSAVLEPQIQAPTWITHHPEVMSPLAKSYLEENASMDENPHRISARAELFIGGKEIVNCYEEENSPVEQRRKFENQRIFQQQEKQTAKATSLNQNAEEGENDIDENYVKALEWGMPPTGGWGCGIDRLVMLFTGRKRIADVLPFGNLANVVGLATKGPQPKSMRASTQQLT